MLTCRRSECIEVPRLHRCWLVYSHMPTEDGRREYILSAKSAPKMISRRIVEKLYVDGMKTQLTGACGDAPEKQLQGQKVYTTYRFCGFRVPAT